MTCLTRQKEQLDRLLAGINPFNAKARTTEIGVLLDSFIPAAEKMSAQLKKYRAAFQRMTAENAQLTEKIRKAHSGSWRN